jgi:hypothetical protein
MVAHEIDAAAVAVVRVEFGRKAIGERAEFQRLGGAEPGAERFELEARPARPFARDPLLQRGVAGKEIGVDEFERLVEDFVRRGAVSLERRAVRLGFDRLCELVLPEERIRSTARAEPEPIYSVSSPLS